MTFTYNYLNLPKTASKTGTSVNYLYDATGTKLRKTTTVGSTTTQRDYITGFEYNKVGTATSAIEMILTEEGYLQRNASNNTYTYHYNLTDHLGNVRTTLQRTTATTGTIIQKQDYYPFGKTKAIVTSGLNKYLYNGKEIQDELGGQYDYGARLYDPEIGSWNAVDPMAEMYSSYSPYAYVGNDPILFRDPNGMYRIDVSGNITINSEDEIDLALDYINSSIFSYDQFSSYVKDEKNGFHYELDPVVVYGYDLSAVQNQQRIAAERYSMEGGMVIVGSGFGQLPVSSSSDRILNDMHTGLDLLGLVPGIGEFADGANALIYAGGGDYLNAGVSAAGMIPFAGSAATGGKLAAKTGDLSRHLRQLEKYGQGGFKELQNGRFRYYGNIKSATKAGEMQGARLVREWNPTTGNTRTWYETLDHARKIRQVHPKYNDLPHYKFDAAGKYIGKW